MFSKTYLQSLVVSLFIVFCSLNIFAQEGLGEYVIKTGKGFLLVENREAISFSIEFKGEKIQRIESDHPNFLIDEKFIQVVIVPNQNFWKPKDILQSEPTAEQLLESHKTWESAYLGESLKTKLLVTSEFFEVLPKRKIMFWSFPMPQNADSPFSHYLFLTTVIGKSILALNSAHEPGKDSASYRTYLIEAMTTLKTSDKPFNIKEISESLAKEKLTK